MREKCGQNNSEYGHLLRSGNLNKLLSSNKLLYRSAYKYQTFIINVLIVNAKQLHGRKKPFRCFIQEQGRFILLVVAKFILSLLVNIKQLTETRMIAPYLNHASLALIYF